jgi:hypothetical protein
MSAELSIWLIYALAATGIVAIALFLWNLACAPYRIASDHLATTSKERDEAVRNLEAARAEIPPSIMENDDLIRRSGRTVGKVSGAASLKDNVLSLAAVALSDRLNPGDSCTFQNFGLTYIGADKSYEATLAGRTERSLVNARFSVVSVGPTYVQCAVEKTKSRCYTGS